MSDVQARLAEVFGVPHPLLALCYRHADRTPMHDQYPSLEQIPVDGRMSAWLEVGDGWITSVTRTYEHWHLGIDASRVDNRDYSSAIWERSVRTVTIPGLLPCESV
jgi:hypothetical protein